MNSDTGSSSSSDSDSDPEIPLHCSTCGVEVGTDRLYLFYMPKWMPTLYFCNLTCARNFPVHGIFLPKDLN